MSIEVMKQALEALELYQSKGSVQMFDDAAKALRERLARPEQDYLAGVPPMFPQMRDGETIVVTEYAQPEQEQRQWQGLTDEEITEIAATPAAISGSYVASFARAIEARLKEKNHG